MLDVLADPLFYDFICTICKNEAGIVVARVIVADACPNDLHLADVLLQNPEEPLVVATGNDTRRKGFGLLGKVFENVERFATENNNEVVTFVAASDSRVKLLKGTVTIFPRARRGEMQRRWSNRCRHNSI